MKDPGQANNSRRTWTQGIAGILLVIVTIAGTKLLETTGSRMGTFLSDIFGSILGSHTIHVVVFDALGQSPVQAAEVIIVEAKGNLKGHTDQQGRVTFDDVSETVLYFQATKTDNQGAITCTKNDPPSKFPFTTTINIDETKCVKFSLAPALDQTVPLDASYSWLAKAVAEIGVSEVGQGSNKRISEYLSAVGLMGLDEKTPWGCAFIGWALREAGTTPPVGAAKCSNFLSYGVRLDGPRIGALGFVNADGIPESRTGLVGIVSNISATDVTMIVGNVNNSVTKATYTTSRVKAFLWPSAGEPPQ